MKVESPTIFTPRHNSVDGKIPAYVGSSNAYDVYVYDDVVILRYGNLYDQFLYFRNKDVFRRFAEVRVDFTTPLKLITKEEQELRDIFVDGKQYNLQTLAEIRERLSKQ